MPGVLCITRGHFNHGNVKSIIPKRVHPIPPHRKRSCSHSSRRKSHSFLKIAERITSTRANPPIIGLLGWENKIC